MLVIDEKTVNGMVNAIFPIDPPKILGANFDNILPYCHYSQVKRTTYTNTGSSATNPTWPSDLVDFSQIRLLVASTGSRDSISSSGFDYFIYAPSICIPPTTLSNGNRYIKCISVPNTSYTKVNVPGVSVIASTSSNEQTFTPLLDPDHFLSTKRLQYQSGTTIYNFAYGIVPGGNGTAVLWYLPYDYTVKEEG